MLIYIDQADLKMKIRIQDFHVHHISVLWHLYSGLQYQTIVPTILPCSYNSSTVAATCAFQVLP